MNQGQFYRGIRAYTALRKQAKYTGNLLAPQLSPILPLLGGVAGGASVIARSKKYKEDWTARELAQRALLGTILGGGLELGRVGGLHVIQDYARKNSLDPGIEGVILPRKLQSYNNLFYFF